MRHSFKPFLMKVSEVGHEVFSSAMDSWCSFYKNWLFSFGKVDAYFLNSGCGRNNLNVDEIPCWNGVLVDFEELIANPSKVLARLGDAFAESRVVKRKVPLSKEQATAKKIQGKWVNGYWFFLNATLNSDTTFAAEKKKRSEPKKIFEHRIERFGAKVLSKMRKLSI